MTKEYTPQEQHIIDESQEISLGENPIITKFFSAFPALENKNYRLYFIGQLVSLTGTWIQLVAQGWLVLQLTHSAFWVGFIAGLSNLPTLLFGLFAGVIVDRYPRRKILFYTETGSLVVSLILGILTILGVINVLEIAVLIFLLGVIAAFDVPARQTFAVDMVGREHITSAVALNSGLFNGARIIGPALAGILIASVGIGWAFIVNAMSFIAILAALLYIRVKHEASDSYPNPFAAIQEGLRYSFSHRIIKILLLFAATGAIFGWSYAAIMPVIAKDIFRMDASGLGLLYSAAGIGAVVGTILVSSLGKKTNRLLFIIGGSMLFSVSILLFTLTSSVFLACVFLFFAGLGLISQFSTMNATIQHIVPDEMRGRVMSIYILMFVGMLPLGSFQIGILSQAIGALTAIQIGAVVMFVCALALFFKRRSLNR